MKRRALLSGLFALPVLGAVLIVSATVTAALDRETTMVVFDFEAATAGQGGGLGDRVVPASSRHFALTSAVFSWTDPDGLFENFTDHGVQAYGGDDPTDQTYSGRGTGPSPDFTHFVVTLTTRMPWLLTSFSMQQSANDPEYLVDIVAVQGSVSTVIGTVVVGGPSTPGVVSLSGLRYAVGAGAMQILILPQVPSPTGSGYLAVDDVTIMGRLGP